VALNYDSRGWSSQGQERYRQSRDSPAAGAGGNSRRLPAVPGSVSSEYPGRVDYRVAVIGGGVSGLAAAFELRRRRPDLPLLVVEEQPVAGGKLRSSSRDGFTFDWGPNGFQPAPRTLGLVDQLGLRERLQPASERARRRYLFRDGGLRPVPLRPREFLRSELLSPAGKARVALEPLLYRKPLPSPGEESVFRFVARHFGGEAARALAGPLVVGVTAGDAERLSLDALFPALRRLEAEHGSVLRGMAAKRGSRSAAPALYSFTGGGMGVLAVTLGEKLADAIRMGSGVEALGRVSGGFELRLTGGETLSAERVVLATPAFEAARLLGPLSPEAAAALAGIRYADVSVLAFGFHRIDVPHLLDGFGFLVPRGQGVRSLGVLWTSSLFESRAPGEAVLLRVIAGGELDPEFSLLDDDQAIAAVRRDLRLTMGINAEPLFLERISLARALPQYELGHRERVGRAMEEARRAGVVLAGNAYAGIAVNDCVRDADRVVDELLGQAAGPRSAAC
jgi:oxygen-dependent protoporphyrinogen oxidase